MKTKNKSIGSFEAKTHLSSLIADIQKGHEYVITKRGKPVARLVPYRNREESLNTKEIILHFDSIRNTVKGVVNIKKIINEGRKY